MALAETGTVRSLRPALVAVLVLAALDGWMRLTYVGRRTPQDSLWWLFDATREQSLPTWWSVVAMALLGWCCLQRARVGTWWRWPGLGFLYLSCDDACMLHERLGGAVGPWLQGHGAYAWIVLLAPVFLGVGALIAARWWRELSGQPAARRCLMLGFGALALALGIEALEERALESGLRWRGLPLVLYDAWLEELLEMLGPVLLFGALPQVAPVTAALPPAPAPPARDPGRSSGRPRWVATGSFFARER